MSDRARQALLRGINNERKHLDNLRRERTNAERRIAFVLHELQLMERELLAEDTWGDDALDNKAVKIREQNLQDARHEVEHYTIMEKHCG